MATRLFPPVRLFTSNRNLGFAGACNRAIRESSGNFILLLNPDTRLTPGAIAALRDAIVAGRRVAAVGPRLIFPNGLPQPSAELAPTLARELVRLLHLENVMSRSTSDQNWYSQEDREVEVIKGACLMLRRAALEEVGLLDEDYFMYSEEVDLCKRLRDAGWAIMWSHRSEVVHHGWQSSRQVSTESFLNLYRGKIMYFRKHYGRPMAFIYKLLLVSASIARLAVSPAALLQRPEFRDRNLALAGRYSRLLKEIPGL